MYVCTGSSGVCVSVCVSENRVQLSLQALRDGSSLPRLVGPGGPSSPWQPLPLTAHLPFLLGFPVGVWAYVSGSSLWSLNEGPS